MSKDLKGIRPEDIKGPNHTTKRKPFAELIHNMKENNDFKLNSDHTVITFNIKKEDFPMTNEEELDVTDWYAKTYDWHSVTLTENTKTQEYTFELRK
jgi:hypothetical protein